MKFLRRLSSALLTAVLAFGTSAPSLAAADSGAAPLREYARPGSPAAGAVFSAPLVKETASVDPDLIVAEDLVQRAEDPLAGQGTVIAILDSGFDVTHPVFVLPEQASARLTRESLAEAAAGTLAWRISGKSADALYVNEKIPFAFDYSGADTDVSGQSAHGTHVAASAAGSDAGEGKLNGTAPGAQLLLMKVFDDRGQNCTELALISAIEDAVKLGADIINLSLGSLSYSGKDYAMNQVAAALYEAQQAGVLVVCAVGNDGRGGALGASSSLPRAADPDYGLPSEPAVIPGTLAVASVSNSVVYAHYMDCAGNYIFYDESYEVSSGETEALAEVLRGKTVPLCVLGGIGTAEEYVGRDVKGAAVLVQRGTITFEEKANHAAAAGASAVIVYDPEGTEPFLMSLGGESAVPTVSVSHENGVILAGLDGENITFSRSARAFPAADSGTASYSSWGPTSDLALKPEIAAVGSSVISAVPDGGYDVMSGTSMASPQIAGMAARLLSAFSSRDDLPKGAERTSLWKAALMSLAQPLTDKSGLPLSPRGQGAGVLYTADAEILLRNEDGSAAIPIGDGAEDGFSFTVRLTNLTDSVQKKILRVPMITDEAELRPDGIWYITGKPERVPADIRIQGEGVSYKNGTLSITLEAGEERLLTISLKPLTSYVEEKRKSFPNGFYLEGFVILENEDGTHEASLPYLAFAGDWEDAPMIDGTDWDGESSYYGVNRLVWDSDEGGILGESPEGVLSSLFAFSPNRDGSADLVFLDHAPLRNIAEMHIEILREDGKVLYTGAEFDLLKAAAAEGNLIYNTIRLWDGSDGINDHFYWENGTYTVQLTLVSYTGGGQILYIPLRIDTEKPRCVSLTAEDGALTASFTDNHALKELRIYLPDGKDGYLLNESVRPGSAVTAEISAALPEEAEYVYVSAEDYAANKCVLRFWTADGFFS